MRRSTAFLIFGVLFTLAGPARADLSEYVHQPDASYSYRLVNQQPVGQTDAHQVHMTSQTWQGIAWEHWLTIFVPQDIKHTQQAILVITGGSNRPTPSELGSGEARLLAQVATQTGVILAVLEQVPNQPLFHGLKEDALIAYTFDQYLRGGDADWPLLLPMVKSAVRAMDTIQRVGQEQLGLELERFIVTGASKRGWTTWLTAAVDPRVAAIAPMVIDMLNFRPQVQQQLASYGQFSEMIHDYTDIGFFERLDTPEGRALLAIVDPYAYRRQLTMPKLIVLGTNDPYWTVDAANLYLSQLEGETMLHYEPNAGHGLGLGVVPTMLAFFEAVLENKSLSQMDWQRGGDGTLTVNWAVPGAAATLWHAASLTRDFRQAHWTAQPLAVAGQQCEVKLDLPSEGQVAYYVQIRFPGPPAYALSTPITVLSAESE